MGVRRKNKALAQVASFRIIDKTTDQSCAQLMFMIIGSWNGLQLFELSKRTIDLITFANKADSSCSRIEASITVTSGNLVKILRSVFEKLNYIELGAMALVGERLDTPRMLC